MKNTVKTIISATLLAVTTPLLVAEAVKQATYTNFVRQVQMSSGVVWDVPVGISGERNSELTVDHGGARFELWTVLSAPLTSYLLDTRYVSTYAPAADVTIT
jgi:hypothetical protein